MCSYNGKDLN